MAGDVNTFWGLYDESKMARPPMPEMGGGPMTDTPSLWPGFPRDPEFVETIVRNLRGGRSVHLRGLPGSGRSELLTHVRDELSLVSVRSVEVPGYRAFVDRPFAGVTLMGVGTELSPSGPPGDRSLKGVADAFERLLGRQPCVLMIDDAAQLDRPSAGIVAVVRSERRYPVLFVSRPGIDPVGSVDVLVASAQPGVEIPVGPLRLGQLHQLVRELLPGVVEPGAMAELATLSGGLPGVLSSIIATASDSGALASDEGVWRVQGDLWSDQLGITLRPFLADVTPEEASALSTMARAGAVPAEHAPDLVPAEMLRRLTQLTLLRSDKRQPRASLYVFPPALAELLRRESGAVVPPDEDQRGPLTVQSGWRARETARAEAASYADTVVDHWRAEIATWAEAWKADPTPSKAVPLLRAMRASGSDPDEIQVVLAETSEDLDDLGAFAEFSAWAATYQAELRGDPATAIADLQVLRKRIPQLGAHARAYEAHLMIMHDRIPDDALFEVPDRTTDPSGADAVVLARIEALLARGQTVDAAELLASFDTTWNQAEPVIRVLSGLARVLGDDVPGGVEWALDAFSEAMDDLDPAMIAANGYTAALGMTLMGSFENLDSIMEVAFRLTGAGVLQGVYRAGLFSMSSIVAGWEGRTDYARSLAAQASSFGFGDGPFPGMLQALGPVQDPATEPEELWDMVDSLLSRGYLANAVFLAVRAVERGALEGRADAVVEQGLATQSAVLRALAGYVGAAAAGDTDSLADRIEELRSHCGPSFAMRAGITRALLLREAGDLEGWLTQTDGAWNEGGNSLGRRCPGLFSRIIQTVGLTQREESMVALAAQGRSTVEIAALTDATKRTVSTHIQTAYRKIGVHSRQDLRRAIATWLTLSI